MAHHQALLTRTGQPLVTRSGDPIMGAWAAIWIGYLPLHIDRQSVRVTYVSGDDVARTISGRMLLDRIAPRRVELHVDTVLLPPAAVAQIMHLDMGVNGWAYTISGWLWRLTGAISDICYIRASISTAHMSRDRGPLGSVSLVITERA